ncbi:N-acetyl sugar amidotransferase [Prochlorococcus marinus]|uniref:N-acetyl sugar amidotransferase n=1 Tax=Prochlorococcus marinus (strain AS9601) TaxID=146891 RepID=A2BSD8_PROMS|nr:N-acetyl sugar amidotransferase [Prochlorococcus marinus]ABM70699.1 Hypothetical protein A9601_14151 [Prochlorococcus marinus str. AS9601]
MAKECVNCLLNDSLSNVFIDNSNICNFCKSYSKRKKQNNDKQLKKIALTNILNKIKDNNNKKYDCIVGVSGGLDSSTVLIKAKELGLRCLAVHMDNGWDEPLSQRNIEIILKATGFDYETWVIDWEEYRDLQKAYIASDLIDIEMLYDNAAFAVNFYFAQKYKVKTILSGENIATEGISMPKEWSWQKYDATNILSIAKSANITLKTFPYIRFRRVLLAKILGINRIPLLNYIEYSKEIALEKLIPLGYQPYPYKHYESVFTRFYQGEILPRKFNIDKRLIHLSSLIQNESITKKEAKKELNKHPYLDLLKLKKDRKFICKKLKLSESDFESYLKRPERSHLNFKSHARLVIIFAKVIKFIFRIKKKIYF